MPMLARMVLSMAQRLGANPADAVAVGETEGAQRAARYVDAPSALEALVADLDRLGFDPIVADGGDPATPDEADASPPSWRSPTARSPSSPRLIPTWCAGCTGAWSPASSPEMGDADVAEFCSLAHRTPCQVAITSR